MSRIYGSNFQPKLRRYSLTRGQGTSTYVFLNSAQKGSFLFI